MLAVLAIEFFKIVALPAFCLIMSVILFGVSAATQGNVAAETQSYAWLMVVGLFISTPFACARLKKGPAD